MASVSIKADVKAVKEMPKNSKVEQWSSSAGRDGHHGLSLPLRSGEGTRGA